LTRAFLCQGTFENDGKHERILILGRDAFHAGFIELR